MSRFNYWKQEFNNQNLNSFNGNIEGLLWLKVRAVSRKNLLNRFVEKNEIVLKSNKIADQNLELFDLLLSMKKQGQIMINTFLKDHNNEWYRQFGVDEDKLKTDLYKVKYYIWGGDQGNSLDRQLISKYVKVICNFDELCNRKEEITNNAWNFVQTSWYNNWTSYLIESAFKRHNRVLSAVGEIKSVDFFIDNFPIDLKVTYFPNEFLSREIKERCGNKQLTWLKKQSKSLNIIVDSKLSEEEQLYILEEKLCSHKEGRRIIKIMDSIIKSIIQDCQKRPEKLIKWLYENQSERLFGAENRLFIVLVDSTNLNESWKMKRSFDIIEPKINQYLDKFNRKTLKNISFDFKNKNYTCLSDIIFIIK